VTPDDLAELRDWYGRAVRALEHPVDLAERRQGWALEVSRSQPDRGPGPLDDRPPRLVLSIDAVGAYLAAPPAQVRDKAGRGVVRDRDRALRLASGRSELMAKIIGDLMPNLRRGRRSGDHAAWLRAIAWHHLVSGGLSQREAARTVIRWDAECDAPGADGEAAHLLRRRDDLARDRHQLRGREPGMTTSRKPRKLPEEERKRLRRREAAVITASRRIVRRVLDANPTP